MDGAFRGAVEQDDRAFVFQRPVHVEVQGSRARSVRLFSMSLSRRGMFLRTESPLPVDTHVKLSIEVRGRVLPFAKGCVAYSLPKDWAFTHGRIAGFGVDFVRLPARSQALIHELKARLNRAAARAALAHRARRVAQSQVTTIKRDAVITAERPDWRTQSYGPDRRTVAGLTAAAFVGGAVAVFAGFGF